MDRIGRDLPARVDGVRRRIEDWRRQGTSKAMPPELWEAAVSLARVHGVYPISRALRIDYGSLKRRLSGQPATGARREPSARFVELAGSSLLGSSPDNGVARASATVELLSPEGSRLVVRLREHEGADLLAFATGLWKSR